MPMPSSDIPAELWGAKCAICRHCNEGFLVFKNMDAAGMERFIKWSDKHPSMCSDRAPLDPIDPNMLVILALTTAPSH